MRYEQEIHKSHAYEQEISTRFHAYEQEIHTTHVYVLKDCKIHKNPCVSSKRDDAIVQQVVEDPVDNDRILVETGADPIPTQCEPSELEKMKHELKHISFKPSCTSCVKGKAQAPHKRIERITEESELSIVQCDFTTFFCKMQQLPTD